MTLAANETRSIVVTGGAGFIGSRLCQRLATSGYKVCVFDNFLPQVHGHSPDLSSLRALDIEIVEGDVRNHALFKSTLNRLRPDIIFHLAAETGTGQSLDLVSDYTASNVLGTANLVEIVNALDCVQKIVLPSSRAIYGEGAYENDAGEPFYARRRELSDMRAGRFAVYDDEANVLRAQATLETTPPAPVSIYASSKLMQEYLLNQGGDGKSWDSTVLRLQNVYGPGQSLCNPYTGVLSIFSTQLLQNELLNIYEDGEIRRDFVYVDDVVSALYQAAFRKTAHASIFNIGSGRAVRVLDVARFLMRAYGKAEDSYWVSGEFREGDIRHACANVDKALNELNWQPVTSLEQGLIQLTRSVLAQRTVDQRAELAVGL